MIEKQEISFLLDRQEFDLLNEIIIADEEVYESIEHAKREGDKYRLKFSYDILDELLGFLAAEANHEKSKKRQERLDNLYDKIEGLYRLSKLVKMHGRTKILKRRRQKIKSKVYIFDIWVDDSEKAPHKPLRKIGVLGTKSLYNFAKAIVQAFDFYFDHPFGFYDNIQNSLNSKIGYELFVDMGEEPIRENFKGVKKTKILEAFKNIGDRMLFLFDYGDNWHFIVELKKIREPFENESFPILLESIGKAPIQYPPCEEDIDEDIENG